MFHIVFSGFQEKLCRTSMSGRYSSSTWPDADDADLDFFLLDNFRNRRCIASFGPGIA